jgi:predicted ester cyclase
LLLAHRFTVAAAPRGERKFYAFFDRMQAAFSNFHVTVHDSVVQGDKICLRWTCKMRHTGNGMGMPPTGKLVKVTGITIIRVAADKIVEAWQNWDLLGLLQQIQGSNAKPATYIATARGPHGRARIGELHAK